MKNNISPMVVIITIIIAALLISALASFGITFYAIRKPATVCRDASALIQSGSFDSNTLTIKAYNYGSLDLTFDATVTKSDGTQSVMQNLFSLAAGETKDVAIADADPNLKEVLIVARECPNAKDYLKRNYIKGLGY